MSTDPKEIHVEVTEKYDGDSAVGLGTESCGDTQYIEVIRKHHNGMVIVRAWQQSTIQRKPQRICLEFTNDEFKALIEAWQKLSKEKAVNVWDENDVGQIVYGPEEWD